MKRLLTAALSAACFLAAFNMADAEPLPAGCGSFGRVSEYLSGDFKEAPVVLGLRQDGSLFQVFASADGATWTVVITAPSGLSCIVADGEKLEFVPFVAPETAGNPS